MAARRCSVCAINWPNEWKAYRKCPACEGDTDVLSNADPIDDQEAKSLKAHHEFERFYAEREEKRQAEIKRLEASLAESPDLD